MKISLILLPCVVLSADLSEEVVSSCSVYNLPTEDDEIYHGIEACDIVQYNKFHRILNTHETYERLKTDNEINQVPNQKTVHCPLEVQDLLNEGQAPQTTGFNSLWIVENNSKEPVVISFVDMDGIEYSAMNPSITPPQNDPMALVLPNEYHAIHGFDGHLYHARSYDPETGNLGPVVMQHRVGLIPVGAKFQDLVCPEDDPEPLVEEVRDPGYQRTPPAIFRSCNTLDIGFRNMANCPLNGYFISSSDEESCEEEFKFHLGKNHRPDDFVWQWDSPTKFEGSFVGHSYAFRSAADPKILVDVITLQPTRVIDCPVLKNKAQINRVTQVGNLVEVALPVKHDGEMAALFKGHRVEDKRIRLDRSFVASAFNQTFQANATDAMPPLQCPLVGSARAHHKVGVDSF